MDKELIAESADESLEKAFTKAQKIICAREDQGTSKEDKKEIIETIYSIFKFIPHATDNELKINAAFASIVLTEPFPQTEEHRAAAELWLSLTLGKTQDQNVYNQATYLVRKSPSLIADIAGSFVLLGEKSRKPKGIASNRVKGLHHLNH